MPLALLANWRLIAGGVMAAGALLVWAYIGHLQHTVQAKTAALREASQALKVASAQIADRDETIRSNAEGERQDASQTASFWKGQARAAFNAGVASHRCPGEPPSVQHDLRSLWEAGRFTAAPGVPGKPVG